MEYIEVRNQTELDKALKRPDLIPLLIGNYTFEVHEGSPKIYIKKGSPSMVAGGSSSPSMVARELSSPSMDDSAVT